MAHIFISLGVNYEVLKVKKRRWSPLTPHLYKIYIFEQNNEIEYMAHILISLGVNYEILKVKKRRIRSKLEVESSDPILSNPDLEC